MFDYIIIGAGSAGCVLIHCPAALALMARTGQASEPMADLIKAAQAA